MFILQNVPLGAYSTMRLGGIAAYLTEINTRAEVAEAITWATERQLPVIMIGTGSNIIWQDDGFPGLVLVNKIMGVEAQTGVGDDVYVTAGAGENWDSFVGQMVERGLTGLEFLSLIPGTVGATPVQNVGAYGSEVSASIVTVEAFDITQGKLINLRGDECEFSYRSSRFNTSDRGRFFITAVTFFLTTGNPKPPYYAAVEAYCQNNDIHTITPAAGREAVSAIRRAKLPDPAVIPNNGSFFGNPIISNDQFLQLQSVYPEVAHWNTGNGQVKLSAAWLIEQAGFKDVHDAETGMATWHLQPLVLINEHATTTAQLLAFRKKIIDGVQTKFGVTLVQEPELLPHE